MENLVPNLTIPVIGFFYAAVVVIPIYGGRYSIYIYIFFRFQKFYTYIRKTIERPFLHRCIEKVRQIKPQLTSSIMNYLDNHIL